MFLEENKTEAEVAVALGGHYDSLEGTKKNGGVVAAAAPGGERHSDLVEVDLGAED